MEENFTKRNITVQAFIKKAFLLSINEKEKERIVIVALFAYLLSSSLQLSSYFSFHDDFVSIYLKLLRYISYICFLYVILINIKNKKYSVNILLVYLFIFVVSVLTLKYSKARHFLIAILLFMPLYKTDINKMIKTSFVAHLLAFVMVFAATKIGLAENYIEITGSRTRDFLGFVYVSTPAFFFLYIFLLYINVKKEKLNYLDLLLGVIINYYLYLKTDTKHPFFVFNCIILLMVLFIFKPSLKNTVFKYIKCDQMKRIPLICVLVSLGLCLYNRNTAWNRLNDIVSGRLGLGRDAINYYGLSLFGQDVDLVGYTISNMNVENYNWVDSSYIIFMIKFGIVPLLLILVLYEEMINKSYKKNNIYLLISLITSLFISVFDFSLFDITVNIFPYLAFCNGFSFENSKTIENTRLWLIGLFKKHE